MGKEESILFLNVVSCPEGLQALADKAPGVSTLTATLDECLNEQKYLVPGLGDFGDRYYGTAGYTGPLGHGRQVRCMWAAQFVCTADESSTLHLLAFAC